MAEFELLGWGNPVSPAPAPPGQPNSSYMAVPGAPQNVDVPKFRQEMASKTADDLVNTRTKAEGAIDFLKISPRTKATYRDSPDVFGPWVGSDTYNSYVRSPAANVSSEAAKNMTKFNQVNNATKELASLGLKARYGARVTNADLAQNQAMFGGLQSADADSAIQSVERMEREHGDTLKSAIDLGLMKPDQVAAALPPDVFEQHIRSGVLDARKFLPMVRTPAEGRQYPVGTLLVTPTGDIFKRAQ